MDYYRAKKLHPQTTDLCQEHLLFDPKACIRRLKKADQYILLGTYLTEKDETVVSRDGVQALSLLLDPYKAPLTYKVCMKSAITRLFEDLLAHYEDEIDDIFDAVLVYMGESQSQRFEEAEWPIANVNC